MTNTVNPAGSVWAVVARATPLDAFGNPIPGTGTIVTNLMVKATMTPVYEAGDAIAIKTAAGELGVYAIHGDIPKWYTVSLEFATPDPYLEQLLTGGTVYSTSSTALGAVTGLTATAETTGGTLAAAEYGYKVAQYNAYGPSIPSSEVVITTTGTTGAVRLTGFTFAAGALGANFYGRTLGVPQKIGSIYNLTTLPTTTSLAAGTVTTVPCALTTVAIPAGYTFTITGDTNTVPVLFTVSQTVVAGSVAIPVNSVTVATTIAGGLVIPTFVDTGAVTPSGLPPLSDMSAGPGNNVGYQTAVMGMTSNPNGIALELWQKRIINGTQATDYPYQWYVFPMVKNLHIMPRNFTNANLESVYEGEAFPNALFGTGPAGTWPWDSTEAYQWSVCGTDVVPVASVAPVAALL
jgi:hypothetical protein